MYSRKINIRIGSPLTPMVKKIMVVNGAVFIVQQFMALFAPGFMEQFFGLTHVGFVHELKIWQVFTYMFLHGSWVHIMFNLLALWMFAGDLEKLWGSNLFLKYYLYSGVGAGFFIAVMNYLTYQNYNMAVVTIGASGAIYALLLAYGLSWPNREVLLYFIFPVKIKYLVLGFGLIEFFGTLSNAVGNGSNISHIGHFGGLVSGFLFIYRIKFQQQKIRKKEEGHRKNERFFRQSLHQEELEEQKRRLEEKIKAKEIIDSLLIKISKTGMDSLSAEEKELLDWARSNYHLDRNQDLH